MRLFVALELVPSVTELLSDLPAGLRRSAPDARWVRPEGIHLTLAFLGERQETDVPDLTLALTRATSGQAPLALWVRGGGTFGSRRSPRVLWLGLEGDLEGLAALRQRVESSLQPLGYAPETREFRPHLTLARARDLHGDPGLAACVEALGTEARGSTTAQGLVLMRSKIAPGGAVYSPVWSVAFPSKPVA